MKKLLLLSMLAVAPVALGQVVSGDSQRNIRGLGFEGFNRAEYLEDVDGRPSRPWKELALIDPTPTPVELDADDTTGDSGEEWVPLDAGTAATPGTFDFKEEETGHRVIPTFLDRR